jgi:outer membrane lipoprotein-sorting protein
MIKWCLALSFFAAHAADMTGLKKVDQVFNRLRAGPGFHARLIKETHVSQLDKETESKGEIDFSKGKMRLDITKPEKLLLVFDGKTAWQEEEYDDGESKKPLITRMPAKNIKKGSAILATLLGNARILKTFTLAKQSGEYFELRPVNKKSDVKLLKVKLDGDDLESVAYVDSLENEVTFKFEHFRRQDISPDKFVYTPPKGAEVNNL